MGSVKKAECGISPPAGDEAGGVLLAVRVIPRARRSELAGRRGDALLVRLSAPPVDGAANAALVELLATSLGIPRSRITLVSGERSRDKVVRLDGVAAADVARLL
jgi:uncharacterized protein (TIGR00251 family)